MITILDDSDGEGGPLPVGSRTQRVYTEFFQLHEVPFSITPDPEFLYLSDTHREVLEKLRYGIASAMGFMLLTGEVGTGKTTLCRVLLDQLQEQAATVYIINPSLNGRELLCAILDDLGIERLPGKSKKRMIDQLNHYLLANALDRPVVIIIDDAQTMPLPTFEDLRLLSNLETDKQKLLQIIMVGQPELLSCLAQPELRQLYQRVAVHGCLDYLSRDEVGGYIQQRLFVAGNCGQLQFPSRVIDRIHKQSKGIPRMINKICDLALTAAYAGNSDTITMSLLAAALSELDIRPAPRRSTHFRPLHRVTRRLRRPAVVAGICIGVGVGLGAGFDRIRHPPPASVSQTTQMARVMPSEAGLAESPKTTLPAEGLISAASDVDAACGPYILQLGSFNTFDTTMRAVDIYARDGITAHWNAVQLEGRGIWYRVYTGRYASFQAARNDQETRGLVSARVIFAPWTIALGPSAQVQGADRLQALLNAHQLDSYLTAGDDGRSRIFSGAFVSRENASAMAEHIHDLTGYMVGVENFERPLVPTAATANNNDNGKSL